MKILFFFGDLIVLDVVLIEVQLFQMDDEELRTCVQDDGQLKKITYPEPLA